MSWHGEADQGRWIDPTTTHSFFSISRIPKEQITEDKKNISIKWPKVPYGGDEIKTQSTVSYFDFKYELKTKWGKKLKVTQDYDEDNKFMWLRFECEGSGKYA